MEIRKTGSLILRIRLVILLLPFTYQVALAQEPDTMLKGYVYEKGEKGTDIGIAGASIYWAGSTTGTISDEFGFFQVEKIPEHTSIVVLSTGYLSDTIEIGYLDEISIFLRPVQLEEVTLESRKRTAGVSYLDPLKVENISSAELEKAACCNLAESFETSPSVDVSFTDAVTGTRQIQLLGLSGPSTLLSREAIPYKQGLGSIMGLKLIPGPWVESIQLTKGAGSVSDGYEGIAGQINFELQKPDEADPLFLNVYANQGGRVEGNAHIAHKFSEKVSTILMLHASSRQLRSDRNEDGFLDMPLGEQFSGLNRWKFKAKNGIRAQIGVGGTILNSTGGQSRYFRADTSGTSSPWGMTNDVRDAYAFMKVGKIFESRPWSSLGFQLDAGSYKQAMRISGRNKWDGLQKSLYANLIYQTIIKNEDHKIRMGANMKVNDVDETAFLRNWDRNEYIPGVWSEYTFCIENKLAVVAGLRADYHNLYGAFLTPRLATRSEIAPGTVLRGSAGRGLRTANIFAENQGLLMSSREFVVEHTFSNTPYGLDPEIAWNYGLSLTHAFNLGFRDGSMSVDFYRTDFQNMIVIDRDHNPGEVQVYNLKGRSRSNAFQATVDYELLKRLDMRLAYRWYGVKATYTTGFRDKPLISPHRAFANLAYSTRNHWKFDATLTWQSTQRIPDTDANPAAYQLPTQSPSFFMLNGQISKEIREFLEFYTGVENALNFRQESPLLAADMPRSQYFDASMVWGPIFGRNVYFGFRLNLK